MIAVRTFVLIASAIAASAAIQQSAPTLRLLEPTEDTILTGPATFRIGMTGGTLVQLVFRVDGVEVCRITAPPFECRWNAGPRLSQRVVQVAATLADGQRLTAAVRTKGVTVSDRSDVDSILVTAHVTDGRGRFVKGLKADDFRVLDEGVPQKVTVIDAGEGGAEVLLALDVSGSMAPNMDDLKTVVRDFLDALRPVDKPTVAGFNSAFFVIAKRDVSRDVRNLAIAELTAAGGTALYDALISGAEVMAPYPGRRAIVLFSDGDDTSSRSTLETAREALHAHDVLLYLVATGKADRDADLRRRLNNLVLETGGTAYYASRLRDTAEHFSEIVQDLSQQYLLAFTPEKPLGDGKWRKLTVEVKTKGLRVRARAGYFAIRRTR